jgi:hypothetical protein
MAEGALQYQAVHPGGQCSSRESVPEFVRVNVDARLLADATKQHLDALRVEWTKVAGERIATGRQEKMPVPGIRRPIVLQVRVERS